MQHDMTKIKAIISVSRDGGSAYFNSKLLEKNVRRNKKVLRTLTLHACPSQLPTNGPERPC
jgi:hypothetical protein